MMDLTAQISYVSLPLIPRVHSSRPASKTLAAATPSIALLPPPPYRPAAAATRSSVALPPRSRTLSACLPPVLHPQPQPLPLLFALSTLAASCTPSRPAALLVTLVLALSLNIAVRYLLRWNRRAGNEASPSAAAEDLEKPPVTEAKPKSPPPVLLYSAADTKLVCATECAIYLAEFVDGDPVRDMPVCGHGFHARCTERCLAGGCRSSCPTCRAPAATPAGGAVASESDAAAS
uniref:RING-type domain-containing protein n=1 Tax=Oryza brachyantha TaxID=4533 RepID=J3LPZ9_ORYBR